MEQKALSLLARSITLLYRESLLRPRADNSADLVRTVLETIKTADIHIGIHTERETILALRSTILEMCSNPIDHDYDLTDLLQQIRINLQHDDKLYEAIRHSLKEELTESGLKNSILHIRRHIANYFKEQQVVEVMDKYSKLIKYRRPEVKDINQYIQEVVSQLEPLAQSSTSKDPAIIADIDIGDDSSMKAAFEEMQKINNGLMIYKTGWQALNRMIQGGFRPGENVVIGALQHKYKTGFSLSLFAQIALFNKAENFLEDKAKKPLLLRISFEDELFNNLEFLYQYLKYNETRTIVSTRDLTVDELSLYVKEKLSSSGFHVKMMRVDPSQWTYKSISNKVIELEAQGYEVKVLMLDYLNLVNKAGCGGSGVTGGDIGELFNRIRHFTSNKKITVITPHQFSTEAKQLLRGGIPEDQFVNEIAEKGYWEGNKGLDRIFDLGILIHLFKHKGQTFLAVRRDKHRISTIIEDKDKYFILAFPKSMPILHDLLDKDSSYQKLPSIVTQREAELFGTEDFL